VLVKGPYVTLARDFALGKEVIWDLIRSESVSG